MSMKGYKTSRDYKRLEELLNKGYEVICFSTYDIFRHRGPGHTPMIVSDVGFAKLMKSYEDRQYDMYHISCRGHCFLNYWPNARETNEYESFADACEEENIEFIDITEEED